MRQVLFSKLLIGEDEVVPLVSTWHEMTLGRLIELVPELDVFSGANVEDCDFHNGSIPLRLIASLANCHEAFDVAKLL